MSSKERLALAKKICSDADLVVVGERIVNRNLREHDEAEENTSREKSIFTRSQADQLNSLWKKTCPEAFSRGDFWKSKLTHPVMMSLVHADGVEIIRDALESSDISNEQRYVGLCALLGKGAMNADDYYRWIFDRVDVAPFQKLMKKVKQKSSWDASEFQAAKLAYLNPSKSYFLKNGEEYDRRH